MHAGWPDDELNAYILGRLRLLGIDLSVLPHDDPEAPADRRRILRSARSFLRSTPRAIADLPLDAEAVPWIYPSAARDDDAGVQGG